MTDMEPKFSSPEMLTPNPEQPARSEAEPSQETPRFTPEVAPASPERAPEQAPPPQTNQSTPIPISLPTPVPASDDAAAAVPTTDDSPAVAADEDLIEKEWVDKAKKIIAETKDDPAKREKQVGQLQADYLKKRYGKELGTPS
jgi:hypothetical protein